MVTMPQTVAKWNAKKNTCYFVDHRQSLAYVAALTSLQVKYVGRWMVNLMLDP